MTTLDFIVCTILLPIGVWFLITKCKETVKSIYTRSGSDFFDFISWLICWAVCAIGIAAIIYVYIDGFKAYFKI